MVLPLFHDGVMYHFLGLYQLYNGITPGLRWGSYNCYFGLYIFCIYTHNPFPRSYSILPEGNSGGILIGSLHFCALEVAVFETIWMKDAHPTMCTLLWHFRTRRMWLETQGFTKILDYMNVFKIYRYPL